jgi:hypothetical protein
MERKKIQPKVKAGEFTQKIPNEFQRVNRLDWNSTL